MNYPNIVFFRYDVYSDIDTFIDEKHSEFNCNFNIISSYNDLNKLYNPNYHLLITYGPDEKEYYVDVNRIISSRIRKRWLHFTSIEDINKINQAVNYCYMKLVTSPPEEMRVTFSIFTTCYKSYEKILRAYNSVKSQTCIDWEWVILDDSPDDDHFKFLCNLFENNSKIRLYKRNSNSGSIGDVKNEVVSLCRGKYVLELDHDDEILPDVLSDSVNTFEKDPDIGFIYMDYANIYENKTNFKYHDCFSLGHSSYYLQKYNNQWIYVAMTPNINNVTLSHIVSVPNHPRIWRKETLLKMGNYSEWLPIADDYELLLRTTVSTKMAKIHKLGYIQYMNNDNNNFSLIRNKEINRIVPQQLKPHGHFTHKIDEKMRELGAFEEAKLLEEAEEIWKRPQFQYAYCNDIIQPNYEKQYCIIGLSSFYRHLESIRELYANIANDIILLDTDVNSHLLTTILDVYGFGRMKCYSLENHTPEDLQRYFLFLYKSCNHYEILYDISPEKQPTLIEDLSLCSRPKVTIITPCIRPENLDKIIESIDFKWIKEWIIVYDEKQVFTNPLKYVGNPKIREFMYYDRESMSGNSQRNFGLDNISGGDISGGDIENQYVYFLDDDNIVHPDLYQLLSRLDGRGSIYTFNQKRPVDIFPYNDVLKGNCIRRYQIDTAMFLVDYSLCKHIQWQKDKYNADGIFIEECFQSLMKNDEAVKWIFIDKVMAYYNTL